MGRKGGREWEGKGGLRVRETRTSEESEGKERDAWDIELDRLEKRAKSLIEIEGVVGRRRSERRELKDEVRRRVDEGASFLVDGQRG